MLKDITLGQYFPGTSPLHRMDPRTKLLILVLYIVTIFVCSSFVPFALCALGLFAAKSRNLVACARVLVQDFGGEVPQTMEDLTTLPGIGRKSANVVLGNAFGLPGFPVDTHVNRVLNRLGLVQESSPEKIERIVNEATDPAIWSNFSHLLILHGRDICHARKPECEVCPLAKLCRLYKKD